MLAVCFLMKLDGNVRGMITVVFAVYKLASVAIVLKMYYLSNSKTGMSWNT